MITDSLRQPNRFKRRPNGKRQFFADTAAINSCVLTHLGALSRSPLPATTTEVHWLATRGEPPSEEKPEVWFGVTLPIVHYGAFAMAVGLGQSGADWLARLTGSPWFDGLGLGEKDLEASGLRSPQGTWNTGGDPIGLPHRVGLVALAINDPGSVDVVMAARLVRTLMRTGRVMVTMPATDAGRVLAQALRTEGAFVVTGSRDISLENLHHFPLRTAIMLRHRRLACVDLEEVLSVCGPGGAGTLFNCSTLEAAATFKARFEDQLLTALWNATPDEWDITKFERCLNTDPFPQILTTADRLDGITGTVDVLMPDGCEKR